ncbi:MAG: cupredoxin domain-containing protein, partial [Thermomicrobiales bacterium]
SLTHAKEGAVELRRRIMTAAGAAAVFGVLALSGPAAWAQDATPEAEAPLVPRPVHIHSGTCDELGDVIQPLVDLTAPEGDRVGQGRRADLAETSYTNVPMAFDAILAEDHAINAHLSAEEIGTYIACGNIGGVLNANGDLVIGLREDSNSGYTGIAFLSPGADGASTDVSVFIAQTQGGGGGRERDRAADEEAATLPAAATPAADAGDEAMVSGEQVPVSLVEFAISMPETLPAGEVTFAVTNDGTTTHSFEIENESMEEELETPLEPGQSALLTVDLAPGTYEVYCPIGNHADQGMQLEVTVA